MEEYHQLVSVFFSQNMLLPSIGFQRDVCMSLKNQIQPKFLFFFLFQGAHFYWSYPSTLPNFMVLG
ncbi:hypothetical protein PRUPE_6G157000 [Prunus persica]|uniref:Uncharacterized protein n=1 Tax=Prunus persica TaxID=3760 RepID=A0A251NR14_PRUPE|nr:hypothetical protein PRUPE_6G157000 [Prunus persica]